MSIGEEGMGGSEPQKGEEMGGSEIDVAEHHHFPWGCIVYLMGWAGSFSGFLNGLENPTWGDYITATIFSLIWPILVAVYVAQQPISLSL